MKINQQTVEQASKDILRCLKGFTPTSARNTLEALKYIMPVVKKANTYEKELMAIRKGISIIREKNPNFKTHHLRYLETSLKLCVRELDHYLPAVQMQVVKAALANVSTPAKKAKRLKKIAPEISTVYANLDRRTKEIITVLNELISVDGNINTDYINEIFDATDVQVNILRDEPSLELLVEAYDLAVDVNETEG